MGLKVESEGITGKMIASSTSKIKKISLIKKNCREKDWCLFPHGEKPHSNGLSFWVYCALLKETCVKIRTMAATKSAATAELRPNIAILKICEIPQ